MGQASPFPLSRERRVSKSRVSRGNQRKNAKTPDPEELSARPIPDRVRFLLPLSLSVLEPRLRLASSRPLEESHKRGTVSQIAESKACHFLCLLPSIKVLPAATLSNPISVRHCPHHLHRSQASALHHLESQPSRLRFDAIKRHLELCAPLNSLA